jgi:hypothetical protein
MLNDFFSSVFTEEAEPIPDFSIVTPPRILPDFTIEQETVKKKLDSLKENKSPGPDTLPPKILKEAAVQLSGPLTNLMNLSLGTGQLPSAWKQANVAAIHKKRR